jgi:hypothetical protein
MILRRLSEHLRAQNWTAVALEFVIVLLGIVIGFQITAWNGARQDRDLERSYYRQLIVDLEADTATARRGVVAAHAGDQHAETLLALIETGAVAGTGDQHLIRAVLLAGYAYFPRATRGTYDELISTGHLRLIRDEALKRDLSRYYERMESARQWDDLVRVEQSAYRAAVRGLLNRQQLIWARQAAGGGLDPLSAPPLDRDGLIAGARARPELPGTLAAMGEVQERLRGDSQSMAEEAAALMDKLRAVLEDRRAG